MGSQRLRGEDKRFCRILAEQLTIAGSPGEDVIRRTFDFR